MDEKTYNVIFFGTPEFAVSSLDALLKIPSINVISVVTQPDKKVGRQHIIQSPSVKNHAILHGIPVHQPNDITSDFFKSLLISLKPDVVVLVAYGEIIPESLLTIPTFGWLNVHASLLPHLRGASPIQHAILQVMDSTGVTLMKIVKKLDAGPIISQERITLEPRENFQSLHDKLSNLGGSILHKTLIPYLKGTISLHNQNDSEATYCRQLTKKDGKIDWNTSAEVIDRFIRAMTPWPGAYTSINGSTLKILSAHPIAFNANNQNGVLSNSEDGLLVSTSNGSLVIDILQPEGKNSITSKEFINGYKKSLPAQLS